MIYEGALVDIGGDPQKRFRQEEIAALAAGPALKEKTIAEIPFYENRDQDGSSSCMDQADAKRRGIMIKKRSGRYVSLSGGYNYRRRYNKPGLGMGLDDLMKLSKTNGRPFEVVDPSQKMNETEINNAIELPYADEVAKLFSDPDEIYIFLQPKFEDAVAVIQDGYPLIVMQYANFSEYNIVPKIKQSSLTKEQAEIRHGVCAHDALLRKGVPHILHDDSWGVLQSVANDEFEKQLKARGQRLLSKDWFEKRVYGIAYSKTVKFSWDTTLPVPQPVKPRYNFTKILKWGMLNDADVKALQDVLKFGGHFPVTETSTGNFYGLTQKGVENYQRKHGIVMSGTPETTGFGQVGPKTLADLNSRYGINS